MDNFLTELSTLILNGVSPAQYVAAFLMATLGGITSLWLGAKNRKIADGQNPEKFSKLYLFINNLQRIALSIVTTFVLIRIANTAFDPNTTIVIAFGLGYSSDAAMNVLRKLESTVGAGDLEDGTQK